MLTTSRHVRIFLSLYKRIRPRKIRDYPPCRKNLRKVLKDGLRMSIFCASINKTYGVWFGHKLLAASAQVAEGRCVGQNPSGTLSTSSPDRRERLVASSARRCFDTCCFAGVKSRPNPGDRRKIWLQAPHSYGHWKHSLGHSGNG